MKFNDKYHKAVLSKDGTYTAYSEQYGEHYHSTRDGALKESLYKHVLPAFEHFKDKKELHILDICFGLGFNTLATLWYCQQNGLNKRLYIYSPELDSELIHSLKDFSYPEEFEPFANLIEDLSEQGWYEDEEFSVELFLGDAREYVKEFQDQFDIVYQDAFSPSTNPVLWTKEYFADIAKAMKKDGILTTYSTALKTRLALYQNGFFVYLNQGEEFRSATLASLSPLEGYEPVDMEHKIKCNPDIEPLRD